MSADVSEAFVRASFARMTPDIAMLVTVSADGLDEPLRAGSWPDGIESRGMHFPFMPFNFTWQGAGTGEVTRAAKLEIANVDGRISLAVRTAIGRPSVDVETVRVEDPDTVELGLIGAGLAQVEIDQTHATGTLSPRDFATEPACAPSYTPSKTPAGF
ncbi:hypothetical protein [Caulobacter sp. 1776]|uniref:hypothetical protein n=1 Tax=Caulobacter sp. 1776 TaxID=3156420 RepID=UPI0033932F3B